MGMGEHKVMANNRLGRTVSKKGRFLRETIQQPFPLAPQRTAEDAPSVGFPLLAAYFRCRANFQQLFGFSGKLPKKCLHHARFVLRSLHHARFVLRSRLCRLGALPSMA